MKTSLNQDSGKSQQGATHASNQLGVILTGLGSPDATTASAVRKHLRAVLGDRRVVELPVWLRWFWRQLQVVRLSGPLSRAYRNNWHSEEGPTRSMTRSQAQKLERHLRRSLQQLNVQVLPAMTFGRPSLEAALQLLGQRGIQRIVVLPLYPQYSSTTTGATWDAVARALQRTRNLPDLRFVLDYHRHPLYIEALAQSVRAHWEHRGRRGKLLFSFLGIPRAYADKGDAYPLACQETAQRVAATLDLPVGEWMLSYQPGYGPSPSLTPLTATSVERLAQEGATHVDVICPGFAADGMETLESVNRLQQSMSNTDRRLDLQYIPALNDSEVHARLMHALILQQIRGWWD